jgi:hypothetical protein
MKLPLAPPEALPEVDDIVVPEPPEVEDMPDAPPEVEDVVPPEPPAEPADMDDPEPPEVEPPAVDPAVVSDIEEPEPADALGEGCIADDPDVVDPEPDAAGRSVPPEGAVDCAKAGAATRAVATRHAAICVLSMSISCRYRCSRMEWPKRGCSDARECAKRALRSNPHSLIFVPHASLPLGLRLAAPEPVKSLISRAFQK